MHAPSQGMHAPARGMQEPSQGMQRTLRAAALAAPMRNAVAVQVGDRQHQRHDDLPRGDCFVAVAAAGTVAAHHTKEVAPCCVLLH
eukprot:138927-Chlamydomonas_euryale.AAC.1